MATWCLINGLKQKLKSAQPILGFTRSALWQQAPRTSISKLYLVDKSCQILCGNTAHVQFLHSSGTVFGKTKGSKQKLNPLKMKSKKTTVLGRVYVHSGMTIESLAAALKKPVDHVYEVLMHIPDTDCYDRDDAVLDNATIQKVVKQSGMIAEFVSKKPEKEVEEENMDLKPQPPPDPSVLVSRPPVVTIMGHVDHGKTTLLDQLRKSNIVDKEFGGITQHIGAFSVTLDTGESICFLDTPGHAAFSAMRSRGAQLTDIVVLVVAADDGVMQQTLESIQHAKQAGVPIIVAINKIDKANADVARSKQMLMEHDILLEEFGGDIQAVEISALKGINLMELQEAIVTQAELMSLKGDPKGQVEGSVVESRVDDKRGRLVTAVIQRGTLKRGDVLIAGTAWAKVRAMFNDSGQPMQSAPPGTPVEILGWRDEIPSAGEEIRQLKESEVKSVIAWRKNQRLQQKAEEDEVVIQEKREEHYRDYHARLVARRLQGYHVSRRQPRVRKEKEEKEDSPQLALVLKGDVDGSVEAILDSLDNYRSTKCRLDIIHYGVGNVSESDVEVAAAFGGEIYAFNVEVPSKISALAKSKQVPVRQHNIIYRLFEDLKEGLSSRLPKLEEHVVIGEAKVLQIFQITLPNKKKAFIAGCRCTQGNVSKKYGVKLVRDEEVLYTGRIESLKYFKNEVDSIKKEQECGIQLDDPDLTFQPQDQIICYDIKEVDQTIDWDLGF